MAFVYDSDRSFIPHVNDEHVVWQRLDSAHWEGVCRTLVGEHARETQSAFAASILATWDREIDKFWQICPKELIETLPHPLSESTAAQRA